MDKYEVSRWADAKQMVEFNFPGLLGEKRPEGETTISVLRATPMGVTISVRRQNPLYGELMVHLYAGHVILVGLYGTRHFDLSGRDTTFIGVRRGLNWLNRHAQWITEELHTRASGLIGTSSASGYEYNIQTGLDRVGDAFHKELAARVQDANWTADQVRSAHERWWEFRDNMETFYPAPDDWGRVYEFMYGEGMEDLLIHDEPVNRVLNVSYAADTLAMLHTFRHLFAGGDLDYLL